MWNLYKFWKKKNDCISLPQIVFNVQTDIDLNTSNSLPLTWDSKFFTNILECLSKISTNDCKIFGLNAGIINLRWIRHFAAKIVK